jgi:5-formyltetrahydrofolate cyclo-ligase
MIPQAEKMSPPAPIPAPLARQLGLQARRLIPPGERGAMSSAVSRRILSTDEVAGAKVLCGYSALGEEVDLRDLFGAFRAQGGSLCLPRISGEQLEFVGWQAGSELGTNRFGIGEPVGEPEALDSIEVIVLPCVAVDPTGTRVGFGAGFYDRTLAGIAELDSPPLLVGAAFDAQLLEAIERRDWDIPLDVVVTEKRTIRTT